MDALVGWGGLAVAMNVGRLAPSANPAKILETNKSAMAVAKVLETSTQTQRDAAKTASVSRGRVHQAQTVLRFAPDLADSVLSGSSSLAATRSDAIWLFQNWSNVSGAYIGNHHNPTHIRKDCRKAGFEWATTEIA